MAMTEGIHPTFLNHSPFSVCTATTRATGRPQKSADNPRTSRPRDGSKAGFDGRDSAMRALEGEVSVFTQAALVLIQPAHPLGRPHLVALDSLVDLRLHPPRQLLLIVLYG